MKLKKLPIISALFLGGLGITLFSSNSGGIVGQSTVGCTGSACHGAQSSSTVIALSGIPAGGWVTGTPYTLTLSVTNAAKVAAGFNLTVNVGTLTAGTGMALNGTTELRHNTPRALVTGTTSWTFTWTAPASGATPLTVNVACNAVNLNGVADANDNWNQVVLNYNAAATAPTVTTTPATAITATTATANGTVNANNASTAVTIEYGTTVAYGNAAPGTPSSVTGTTVTNVSRPLSGLLPATLYHYRVVGVNSAGTTNGADMTFTTAAAVTAPTVTTAAATAITTSTATVNGTVNANNANATVTIEYGTSVAYGSTATATPASVSGAVTTNVSAGLASLLPGTTYHYRVVAVNSAGTTNGADMTFTTLVPAVAPTVTTTPATAITSNSASGNGIVNANGSSTTVTVDYGTTLAYGSTVAASPSIVSGSTALSVTSNLIGLAANTLYHYRVKAINAGGTTVGADATFTTAAAAPFAVTTAASGVGVNSATINGAANANNSSTSVSFEYGTTIAYGSIAVATPSTLNNNLTTSITAALSGLLASTTYHYRIVATNAAGTTNGSDLTFTTTAAPALPTVITNAATSITGVSATANGSVNANNAVTAVSIEYGTTVAYGSTVAAVPANVSGNTATNVTGSITGLQLNTLYHYRVTATNSVGTTRGADMTFTTAAINIAAPTVVTTAATSIGSNDATANGTVNPNGANATVTIEYGPTIAYGNAIAATPSIISGSTTTAVTGVLSALTTSTLYHYRIVATNSQGTTNGADVVFSTLQVAVPPVVTLEPATNVSNTGITLNGTVNTSGANATVIFEYGVSSTYGTSVNATPATVNSFTPANVSATLNGLRPSTRYHFRLKATSSAGTTYSTDGTFTTGSLSIGSLNEDGFSIYPNPAFNLLTINTKPGVEMTFSACSLNGSAVTIVGKKIAEEQYQLDVSQLAAGNYLLVLKTAEKNYTTQFTKQ